MSAIAVGTSATITCAKCEKQHATFPAPDWLKARIPAAVQCYGADAPPRADGDGQLLEIDQDVPEAVAMACPSCAGGLRVTAGWERTHPCEYCGTEVFIPDALWKRLHPVKIARHWGVRFEGLTNQQRAEEQQRADVKLKLKDPPPTDWGGLQQYYTTAILTVQLGGYRLDAIDQVTMHMQQSFRGRSQGKKLVELIERLLRSHNADRAIKVLYESQPRPAWVTWMVVVIAIAAAGAAIALSV